ncbi:MAG: acyl-CoA/acyl-ACP dehydrogenase [Granulosicoccus sp.]|nr:acyl-CoA/acyl-ACP dehydrogenase [Granulosicoccus sp.]
MENDSELQDIRDSVKTLCAAYPEDYWKNLDATGGYPTEFVREMTDSGFLGCLIPESYGGSGLGLVQACAILEEISRSGGHPGAAHAQMYVMGSVLRHGTVEQKNRYLPAVAAGELRLQSFAVTEPTTGTDTTALKTTAKRMGDDYVVNGQKVWISRVQHSDLMVLLARTRSVEERVSRTDGLSCFIVDLRGAEQRGLTIKPIDAMINHHSCELFFDDFLIPAKNLLGEEHNGFRVIMDGMNAERILIGSECIGDARYFIDKATAYASQRVVFGRPIGQNQGVSFPIASAYAQTEAAALMVQQAARLFDAGRPCGAEANMAKMLAADASWKAGDTCLQTHGGFGMSREYHIERKLRETRLYQIAPISTNLILSYLSEHVLGMPRSF